MDPQTILNELLSDYGELPYAELGVVVAAQRAAGVIHQAHHWRTRGPSFYSDHLLFERLYSTTNEQIDGLAEKTVGLGSHLLVEPQLQMHQIDALVEHFCSTSNPTTPPIQYPQVSLDVEQLCVLIISHAKDSLEAKGQLTDGVDNMLQGLLDIHEGLIYLLKQRMGRE